MDDSDEPEDDAGDPSEIICAFCLGDEQRITDAFLRHDQRAFRAGDVADRFVELPVHFVEVVLHLPDALADVLGLPRVPQPSLRRIAEDDEYGRLLDEIPRDLVERLAVVSPAQVAAVLVAWERLAAAEMGPHPRGFASPLLAVSLRQLIEIAALSVSSGKPLIALSAM